MKITRFLATLAIWGSLTASGVLAQTLVEDPHGFRTQVPAGLTVRQDPSGVVAGNSAQTVAIVMKAHAYANFEAFAADANLQRDGFSLVGEPRSLDRGGGYFRAAKL